MAINTKLVIESTAQPRPVPGLYLRNGLVVLVTPYKGMPWAAPGGAGFKYEATYIEGDAIGQHVQLTEGDFDGPMLPWPGAITLQNEVDL